MYHRFFHTVITNKILIVSCMMMFFMFNLSAQDYSNKKVVELCRKATEAMNAKNFEKAENYLKKAIKLDSTFADIYVIQGDIYNFSLKSELAADNYEKAIRYSNKPKPILYFITAEEEVKCARYARAKANYLSYLEKIDDHSPLLKDVDKGLKICDFAIGAMSNPVAFEPVNMGFNINSDFDEYLPALVADESEIIFTVMRPRDEHTICNFCDMEEDFYASVKIGEEWQPRFLLEYPLNSGYNEGAQCISPDGHYLFFTLCNTDFGNGSCDLYWSKRIGNRWSRPRNFDAPVNTKFWESQPSISPDGKTIYFVSNRPGGVGKMDLWKTEMTDEGVFSVPENLGPTINTEDDDSAPFIHADGRTLYFVSNGHIGMGGRDIFFSTRTDTGWTKPVNLGYPINSSADEINLLINASGTTAYFSSDKDGGFGGQDLYYFTLDEQLRPTPVTYMKGRVYDDRTKQPLKATIELVDLKDNKVITSTYSDPVTGEFLACILTGTNVLLNVSHPYYPFYSENFQIEANYTEIDPYLKDIPLRRPEIGETFVLRNVFFDFDQSILKDESFVELDKLVDYLNSNTNIKIELGGHTDNQGSVEYNRILSLERAKAVYNYLINKGISANRLTFEGYGMSKPIATNDTEPGKALNRRTEFKIVSY
ncbi:MAG: OmpA family protein [Bacteroidales bacterium]|jgi:outer membrane protein OmpA-like peptidoglycan-associated protein/Tol biopolymer transport system component|nr:OmpA family protein [Bacteroidales bacterium]MDD4394778.1 OmpA family protein [Bacteroidales bacterium]